MLNPRITFILNNAAFFVSHRLPIALAARREGYTVSLLTGQPGSETMDRSATAVLLSKNIKHNIVAFKSSSMNPLRELFSIAQLVYSLLRDRPDLVHCASPKGILYGGIAARISGVKAIVLAVSGMGFIFTDKENDSILRLVLQRIYLFFIRITFKHPNMHVIVQNKDDLENLISTKLLTVNKISLIQGSGVNLSQFTNITISQKKPTVLFPARMLSDKGLYEFVEASRILKTEFPAWKFVLAGAADYGNPSSVSLDVIEKWNEDGIVEWVGHKDEMCPLFSEASIVCLPSYREGMPKSLLEAAAAGCSVVTTDVTGCREAIIPGETGNLVPKGDVNSLTIELRSLMLDSKRRERYGIAGQVLAKKHFDINNVINQTMEIYVRLLGNK